MALPDRHRSNQGFTLVEIALVMVVIGLLVGLGAALIGPLTDRAKLAESREVVNAAKEAILGFFVQNSTAPASIAATGARSVDAWGRNLVLRTATELASPTNACSINTTTLQLTDSSSGAAVNQSNIAFIVYSAGRDADTGCTGAILPLIQAQGFGYTPPCTATAANPPFQYDDIVQYVSLAQVRAAMGCPQPLTVASPATLSEAEEDSVYSYQLQATGGRPPYTWTAVTAGGLNVSTTGLVSGVANANAATNTGELPACSATISLGTAVTDSAGAPAIAYTASVPVRPKPLKIVTETLPVGAEGSAYTTNLSASGGRSNYTWSIIGGALPAGLALSTAGVISGNIASDAGCSILAVANFTVQLVDTCTTTTKPFSLTVNDPDCFSGSSSSTSSTSSSSSSGGAAPTCSLSPISNIVVTGNPATLNWSSTGDPSYASFSPTSGTCTTFASSTGGTCTTANLVYTTRVNTFSLSVSNASGFGSCSTTVYAGRSYYRVWNNTGATYRFMVAGLCRSIGNGAEITTTSGPRYLLPSASITRHLATDTTCVGAIQASISYTTAALVDSDNDGYVNFTGTDR